MVQARLTGLGTRLPGSSEPPYDSQPSSVRLEECCLVQRDYRLPRVIGRCGQMLPVSRRSRCRAYSGKPGLYSARGEMVILSCEPFGGITPDPKLGFFL